MTLATRLTATAAPALTDDNNTWVLFVTGLTNTSTDIAPLGIWWSTPGATDADKELIVYTPTNGDPSQLAPGWTPKGIMALDGDTLVGVPVTVVYSDSVVTVADLTGTESLDGAVSFDDSFDDGLIGYPVRGLEELLTLFGIRKRFDSLDDVSATGADAPTDGQVPVWDNDLGKWVPGDTIGTFPKDAEVYDKHLEVAGDLTLDLSAFPVGKAAAMVLMPAGDDQTLTITAPPSADYGHIDLTVVVVGSVSVSVVDGGGIVVASKPIPAGGFDVVLAELFNQGDTAAMLLVPSGFNVDTSGAGSGDVVGPGSSTAHHFAKFADTTGKLLEDGGVVGGAASLDVGTGSGDVAAGNAPAAAITAHLAASDPHGDRSYATSLFAANDALLYKGAIDCSANPNYPAGDAGHAYKVSFAGKIGGASGVNVEVGDLLVCTVDSSSSGNQATVGANWDIIQVNLDGAVIGPASATDNRLVVADGTSGRLVKMPSTDVSVGQKLASVTDPTSAQHAATKNYVDTADGLLVPKSLYDANTILYATTDDTPLPLTVAASRILGRKASGDIGALTGAEILAILTGQNAADFDLNSHKLTGVTDPTSAQHAATKAYVDLRDLTVTAVKTTAYNANAGEYVRVDTTSGTVAVTLPTAPADGTVVSVKRVAGTTNTASVVCGGSDVFNVAGGATTATLTLLNQAFEMVYRTSGAVWVVNTSLALSQLDTRFVGNALFDANTILAATTDDTPVALTVAASRIVGRKASGDIGALTGAEILAILTGQNGADFDVNSHKLTNVSTPTASGDAATKGYVDGLAFIQRLTANADNATSTLADITDLVTPTQAVSTTWKYEWILYHGNAATSTAGIDFSLTVPTGATVIYNGFGPRSGSAPSLLQNGPAATAGGTRITFGNGASGSPTWTTRLFATVTTDGTHSGAITPQFAQATNTPATTTRIFPGSTVEGKKIP